MASRRPFPPTPHPPQASTSATVGGRLSVLGALVVLLLTPQPADPNKCLGGMHSRKYDPRGRTSARFISHLVSRRCESANANGSDAGKLELLEAGRRESRLFQSKHPLASTHGALLPSSLPVYLLIAPSHSSFPSIPNSFVTSISLSSSVPELFRGPPIKTTRLLYMTLINSHKFLASSPHYKTPRDICGPVARTREPGTRMTTLCK